MPVSTKSPFKALMPHESVGILLLVENSSTMSKMWNEVHQHSLAPLGEMLQFPNGDSSASMTTFLLESMSTECGSRLGALPRRYSSYSHALESVKFCPRPGNVITPELISRGIDILSSARMQGYPSILHLVIVSASSKCSTSVRGVQRPWDKQVLRLKEAGIRCHLVYRPNQDMGGLASLFNTATKIQNLQERALPLMSAFMPVGSSKSAMVVRLAVPGPRDTSGGIGTEVGKECAPSNNGGRIDYSNSNPSQSDIGSGTRGRISRRVRTPHVLLPNEETVISTPPHQPPAKSSRVPGIVARLQQVHGLTKKKLYGSANRPTSITPFFKEERTNSSTQSTPSRSTESSEVEKHINHAPPSSNSGGKVQTRSRESRKNRQAKRSTIDSSRPSRGAKNPSRSPASGNSLPPSISPSSPTQRSIHSSYSDASGTTTAAAPGGLCDSCSPNFQGQRELTFSHTDDVTHGLQPLPSHLPTLGSSNGTPDYSGPYMTTSDIMTLETSLNSRFDEPAHFVDPSPSIFVQSNIDYTWNPSSSPYNPNPAPANSFPWDYNSNSDVIIPSHDLNSTHSLLHAEAADGQNSTPQTLSCSSPGIVSYISSEHTIFSNHLANTAEPEHGSYGPTSIEPESRSPTTLPTRAYTSYFISDSVLGVTPHVEASSPDSKYSDSYYYPTMDSPPQFYHSSSSSLSAMIIPQIKTNLLRTTTATSERY